MGPSRIASLRISLPWSGNATQGAVPVVEPSVPVAPQRGPRGTPRVTKTPKKQREPKNKPTYPQKPSAVDNLADAAPELSVADENLPRDPSPSKAILGDKQRLPVTVGSQKEYRRRSSETLADKQPPGKTRQHRSHVSSTDNPIKNLTIRLNDRSVRPPSVIEL